MCPLSAYVDEKLLDALAGEVAAPDVLDVEVLSVLRGLVLGGTLDTGSAEVARRDFFDLDVVRYETAALADRIWGLRHQYTSYDAAYLALSEALAVPLWTCDTKLGSGGHRAQVHLTARSPA